MTLPPVAQLGIVGAVFVTAFLVGHRVERTEPLVAVPQWVRAVVAGLALGLPMLLEGRGLLTTPFVDGTTVMFALMPTLWLVAMRVVGVGTDSTSTC